MKNVVLLAISLVLFGCGGAEFTTGFSEQAPLETGGAPVEADSAPAAGGASGGHPGTGGSPAATGGTPAETGGSPSTGGSVVATGGAPAVDACALVTHDNGLGQTWEDCVPLYTYNEEQALKACKASGAVICLVNDARCGGGKMQGFNADRSEFLGEWSYESVNLGYVSPSGGICSIPGDRQVWT